MSDEMQTSLISCSDRCVELSLMLFGASFAFLLYI